MNKTMIKNLKRALLLLLISTILYSCSSKVQNTETLESKQISNTSTSVEIVTTRAETIESPDNAELFILNIPIEEEIKYVWEEGNFKEGDTANIYLNQKAKFLNNQKLMDITYTDNRNDYSCDEVFANFRNVNTSFIKDNILYRGASPIDNKHNRAKYDTLKANSIDDMLRYLAGEENKDVDLKDINWANVIGRYLTDNGFDVNDMENWYKKVTK